MRPMQKIFALALVLLLAATVYGLVQTAQPLHAPGTRNASGTTAVDQTPILTALKLAKMPRSEDEQPFAEQALETADRDMDVAMPRRSASWKSTRPRSARRLNRSRHA